MEDLRINDDDDDDNNREQKKKSLPYSRVDASDINYYKLCARNEESLHLAV